jgi:hypothetical protein
LSGSFRMQQNTTSPHIKRFIDSSLRSEIARGLKTFAHLVRSWKCIQKSFISFAGWRKCVQKICHHVRKSRLSYLRTMRRSWHITLVFPVSLQ